jgi:hypothetical protein
MADQKENAYKGNLLLRRRTSPRYREWVKRDRQFYKDLQRRLENEDHWGKSGTPNYNVTKESLLVEVVVRGSGDVGFMGYENRIAFLRHLSCWHIFGDADALMPAKLRRFILLQHAYLRGFLSHRTFKNAYNEMSEYYSLGQIYTVGDLMTAKDETAMEWREWFREWKQEMAKGPKVVSSSSKSASISYEQLLKAMNSISIEYSEDNNLGVAPISDEEEGAFCCYLASEQEQICWVLEDIRPVPIVDEYEID